MKFALFCNDLYQTEPGVFQRDQYSPYRSDAFLYESFEDARAQLGLLERDPRLLNGWTRQVPLPFHILDLTFAFEGPCVLDRLFNGRASALLVTHEYSPAYRAAVEELYGPNPSPDVTSSLVFLEGLSNGGQKGAGLAVLNQAIGWARKNQKLLVVYVQSLEGEHDRLLAWYLKTGWLMHAADRQGFRLKFILVPRFSDRPLP